MMKNVLVVDSDQAMLRTLTGILKSQGGFLNVFAASNTREALELLQKTTIEIVITAIRLPRVDGFRLVARLTRNYPAIKVIVMTKDAHPLLRAGIRRFQTAAHLDQTHDLSMLTKRIFTELQIDYGGHLRGINLSSFLQMMELEGSTCTLRVTSKDKVGLLWLKSGELIAAQSETAKGKEAALDIVAWKNIFIDIDYAPREVERQISMPLMMLILESGQRDDEIRSATGNIRKHERYDLLVAIDYNIKDMTRQCSLRDISLGGAYIESDEELETGKPLTLTLSAPALKSSCSIEAEVIRKEGRGAGIRFKASSPEQQQIIKAMIDNSIKSRRRQEKAERAYPQVV